MEQIKNKREYDVVMARIEELLPKTWGDDADPDSPESIELALLSGLIADYEDKNVMVEKPTLIEVLKLRMYEMGLTQAKLAAMIGVSASRVNEYLSGKSEPTLKIGRQISKQLNIDANIVLGV